MSEKIDGVICAGGKGTRLGLPYNKHRALVYDRLMIEYPIETMKDMGVEDPIIITNGDSGFIVAGYRHSNQAEPKGMPDAIYQAKGQVHGNFPVLAGDVYFDPSPEYYDEPTLFWHEFAGANEHTVWHPESNTLVEKPTVDLGSRAIVAYIFDEKVFDIIESSEPSERGELEMTDIYRWYIQNGCRMQEYRGFFADMGTPDGLLKVANYVERKKMYEAGPKI